MRRSGRVAVLVTTAVLGVACAGAFTAAVPSADALTVRWPAVPFRPGSIWRAPVPSNATFTSVTDALYGDAANAPLHAGVDLVTLCTTDASAPLVSIERSAGWTMPDRATSTGQVLYQRHLSADACADVSWTPIGNSLWVLLDPTTGLADLGVGGWRASGGPLLNSASVGSSAHNLDVRRGDGLTGYGRASGLPALGGLLRAGELDHTIRHPVAINVANTRLSATRNYVWPARSADGSAPIFYQGPNPAFAMGTLLAIPRSVRISRLTWSTPQGRHLATAAQKYGFYIVDSHGGGNFVQFAMETGAARSDLGLTIDPVTGAQRVDPARFDITGFDHDVAQMFALLQAVTSNTAP